MGLFSDVWNAAKDLVTSVVSTAVRWVYDGLAWALGLVMPQKTADKIARTVTSVAVGIGAAALYYFGWKLLFPAAGWKASLATVGLLAATPVWPLGGLWGGVRLLGRGKTAGAWLRYAYGAWALFGIGYAVNWSWERTGG